MTIDETAKGLREAFDGVGVAMSEAIVEFNRRIAIAVNIPRTILFAHAPSIAPELADDDRFAARIQRMQKRQREYQRRCDDDIIAGRRDFDEHTGADVVRTRHRREACMERVFMQRERRGLTMEKLMRQVMK